jgi:hypothetical protein
MHWKHYEIHKKNNNFSEAKKQLVKLFLSFTLSTRTEHERQG